MQLLTQLPETFDEQNDEFIENSEYDDLNYDFKKPCCSNKEELCAALLCLFFFGKFNQSQFMISTFEVQKTFNDLAKVILDKCDDSIKYDKNYFCSNCGLIKEKIRDCDECFQK